jgi:hypothetical protein
MIIFGGNLAHTQAKRARLRTGAVVRWGPNKIPATVQQITLAKDLGSGTNLGKGVLGRNTHTYSETKSRQDCPNSVNLMEGSPIAA